MRFNLSQISFEDLHESTKKGWIPGPEETEKKLVERIKLLQHFFSYPPSDIDQFLTDTDWLRAQEITREIYDISPDWIVGFYSNKKLSFLQGAATWISEKEGLRIPLIQLRKKFQKGKLLGYYKKDEVLAHEAVHAARMQFDEPLFEEIFAYKTSPRIWRRIFGPIFQSPAESTIFLFTLFLYPGVELFQLFYGDIGMFSFLAYIPFIYLGFLLFRLGILQGSLAIALKRLEPMVQNKHKRWAAALRMTDSEILQFAFFPKKKIETFLKKESSLRWQLLKEFFFKKS